MPFSMPAVATIVRRVAADHSGDASIQLDGDRLLELLITVGARKPTSALRLKEKLTDPQLTSAQKVSEIRKGLTAERRADLAVILDEGAAPLSADSRVILVALLERPGAGLSAVDRAWRSVVPRQLTGEGGRHVGGGVAAQQLSLQQSVGGGVPDSSADVASTGLLGSVRGLASRLGLVGHERGNRSPPTEPSGAAPDTTPVTEAEVQAKLSEFLPAYGAAYDQDGALPETVPVVVLERVGQFVDCPDYRIFQLTRVGWVNKNPDPRCYTYSSSAGGYSRTRPQRPEDAFFDQVVSQLRQVTEAFEPKLEERVAGLEAELLQLIEARGLKGLHHFALRGISCSDVDAESNDDHSLAVWRNRRHISADGGNFFVMGYDAELRSARELLAKLMASAGAVARYADARQHPVVLVIKMDNQLTIPASGGNDAITGDYPHTFVLDGQSFHAPNLDVGCMTRPGRADPVGIVKDGIPLENVVAEIGSEGIPAWLTQGINLSERTAPEQAAMARWFYAEILENLVGLNQQASYQHASTS